MELMRAFTAKMMRTAIPYVADLGVTAYLAVLAVSVTVTAAEFLLPGSAVNVIAPQALLVAGVITGGIALGAETPQKRSLRMRIAYAALGLASSVLAFFSAWYYFASVPDVRARLATAIALVVGMLFVSASKAPNDL